MPLGPVNVSSRAAGGMGLEVDMDPSPLLMVASFNKLGLDIRSFHEPLKRSIQQVVAPSMVQNFYAQGRPDQWPELAQATVDIKSREGFTSTAPFPLVRTGALRKAAGQLNLWKIDGVDGTAIIELPASLDYGRIHQEGANEDGVGGTWIRKSRTTGKTVTTTFGVKGFVPQRMWAIIQDEDVDKIDTVFSKWLSERALAAGFLP